MAPVNLGLLLPSIAHLLAAWPSAEQRFHAHLERLNPRLRYLLPRTLPRYARLALHRVLKQRGVTESSTPGLSRLGRRLRASGFNPSDLDTLGAALLASLDDLMGERLDGETREEWVQLYRGVLRILSLGGASA